MDTRFCKATLLLLSLMAATDHAASADAQRGAQVFRQCMACHSTEPGVHMTGPSLAHVWGRKAGTVEGFSRYSDALANSAISWGEQTLDKWLTNPARVIPGNAMSFPGIANVQARQDLIAYLKAVSEGKAPAMRGREGGMMGGGMMGGGKRLDLKTAPPEGQVTSIKHCRDTYTITTADGKNSKIWEFNLRLKTDSSSDGPSPGKPVVVGAGMQGDRASLIFASPTEISAAIKAYCP